jgi:hypothetical protein
MGKTSASHLRMYVGHTLLGDGGHKKSPVFLTETGDLSACAAISSR